VYPFFFWERVCTCLPSWCPWVCALLLECVLFLEGVLLLESALLLVGVLLLNVSVLLLVSAVGAFHFCARFRVEGLGFRF
jgi:hypothetical protein